MTNLEALINWGKDILVSKGRQVTTVPETILLTPWSTVIRFNTSAGAFYLKQTPPDTFLSSEPYVIKILAEQFHANVPEVIAINNDLHCFIMRDAGKSLRLALKEKFDLDLLCQVIKQFSAIMRSTETHIDIFLELGVPDWRLNNLPVLYQQIINQKDFLNLCGLTDQEVQILHKKLPEVFEQCKLLTSYGIPETLGYHDFHDKNVLFDSNTKKMTFSDFGETAIINPFLSLYNCIQQAITHHRGEEGNQTYRALQAACFENWPGFTKEQTHEIFLLVKCLHPIYSVLACYKFMTCLDLEAYKAHYSTGLPPAKYFREYIENASLL